MYHVSCLWTRISKCSPYLGTPHGSQDGGIVSFSSFPQPEQIYSEQYQITSSETFWTPKCPEIGRRKFLYLLFNDFLCWRPSLNIQKHLYSMGILHNEEMCQAAFNKHHFISIFIQDMRIVKYSPLFLGLFEELVGPDSVTVGINILMSVLHISFANSFPFHTPF